MPARASHIGSVSRRDVVKGAAALAAGAALGPMSLGHLAPGRALAQAPKRGGVVTVRAWDPPHFDPHLTISYKTHIAYSFTHSRLLKYKAGPSVAPGVFPIEGDVAESWSQPNETTYVFKLRPGVRWHAKPPVNGRELTADDVVYSVERFRTVKGNANAYMLSSLDKVEALDKYTVRFHSQGALRVVPRHDRQSARGGDHRARECVDKFGDLKKPEATVGTGPWMLDSYRPNLGMTMVRHPGYFMAGLPYIDRVSSWSTRTMPRAWPPSSRASTTSAGSSWASSTGRLGEHQGHAQAEAPAAQTGGLHDPRDEPHLMRTDKAPFSDVRVRRAMSMAIDRKGIIDAVYEGVGAINPPIPAALREWSVPIESPMAELGEGAQYYRYDPTAREEAPRRGGLSQGLPRDDGLHDLRLHRHGGHSPSSS